MLQVKDPVSHTSAHKLRRNLLGKLRRLARGASTAFWLHASKLIYCTFSQDQDPTSHHICQR